MRRPSFATVLAFIALFVALGGPAEARRPLTGKDIKSSTLTGKHIKNRSLGVADLSASANRQLKATAAESVGTAQLAAGAVTASKLAPGAVGSAAVADESLGAADLAAVAVTSPARSIADDAVVVTPPSQFPDDKLLLSAAPTGPTKLRVRICNVLGTVAIDLPSMSFRYISFDF